MALCKSAALAALLLASASAALPGGGEGGNVDADSAGLLSLSATSAQHGEHDEMQRGPMRRTVDRLRAEVGEQKSQVADLKKELSCLSASVNETARPCCESVYGKYKAQVDELKAKVAKQPPVALPAEPPANPCEETVESEWEKALGDLDFKATCRNADFTGYTIKKDHAPFGSECYGRGSVTVESLVGHAEEECTAHCKTFGIEVGQMLAELYCNSKNVTLDNYWLTEGAYPVYPGGFREVLDSCITAQQENCKDAALNATRQCESGRPSGEGDFAQVFVLCGRARHAINPDP